MSPIFSRALFASASIVLTFVMVTVVAPATAAVSQADIRQSSVRVNDLNLDSVAGRHMLARRLDAAVDAVCPADEAADRFAERQCRKIALKNAEAAITRATRVAS